MDYERIKDVGPDRAASEWLLRCGAKVRYCGHQKWLHDYNKLPGSSIDRYKIQAIDATDSCIMDIGLDHMVDLEHVEKITLCKCHYIEDNCLQRLSQLENLRKSLLELEIIACGNVTDNGIIALRHFNLGWPGTCYVDQAGLEFIEICLPLPPEVLEWKRTPSYLEPQIFVLK
ncbi:ATP synthase subunit s, mitochondrial [Apodemus speciosus]|uniref:ATP synthase subunit s, mitochondrial n=1 Tax=Apodemus speciosus TaxID=105296 RepID=A0ABQ0FE05_APOSI